MKKTLSLGLVLLLLGLLIPGRVLSSSGTNDQPESTPEPQLVQANPKLYLPIVSHNFSVASLFGGEFVGTTTGLTDMKNAGAYWARINGISWADVEPSRGARDWAALAGFEQLAMAMRSQGMEVIAIIRETPAWAQKLPGSVCGPIKDGDIPAFANFVKDVVARYSQSPYFIKHWEIENEMDVPMYVPAPDKPPVYGCWGDPGDQDGYYGGGYYAKVIKQVYPAVKAADPLAQVLLGGLLLDCDPNNPPAGKDCSSAHYLEGVLAAGGGDFFDAVSFHAYDYYGYKPGAFGNPNFAANQDNHPVLWYKTEFLKNVLNRYGYGDKPLLNTEVALLLVGSGNDSFEITKAYFLARAYADAIKLGLQANIWYTVAPAWRSTSLVQSDGTQKDAYRAFKFAHQMMANPASITDLSLNSTVHGYEFRFPDRRVWLLWTGLDQSSTINLPSAPRGIYDALGNFQGTNQSLKVDFKPVYVEFGP